MGIVDIQTVPFNLEDRRIGLRRGKYTGLLPQVPQEPGQALRVRLETYDEACRLSTSMRECRRRGYSHYKDLQVSQNGTIVYLWRELFPDRPQGTTVETVKSRRAG